MKSNILKVASVTLMSVFLLCACSTAENAEVSDAPDVSLNDMDGNKVQLSAFKGKVIILDFFATWCPPCRQEIPDFVELQKQYGDKGFVMLGASMTPADDVKPFAEKMGINYVVLISDEKTNNAYGPIRSIPTTFVIDKEFNIVRKYIGYKSKETFENDIKEFLGK